MNVISTQIGENAFLADLKWQRRLDALVRGECSEDDFMNEVLSLRETNRDSAWNVVALLDQRFRRGQIPAELFRSIESKIAQCELGTLDYGTTIDLDPALDPDLDLAAPEVTAQFEGGEGRQTDPSASLVLEIGRVLRNRYVLERRLGSGGMGAVFKALDHYRCDLSEDNRHVAIKFLHPKINGNPQVLANLRREFYCAQALSHDNIVKVYELDQDGEAVFFTMEFLEGELLSTVMERSNPQAISRPAAWTMILQLGAGLSHAHARNVVHGDLKPQNIMTTQPGELRILDFGASSAMIRRNSTALTPAYASCELLEGKAADPRDDLYALACVTYELLAGEHPFQRRPSTEARDLGLAARRPPGLALQQWETLAMGLAWRREDRSISVHDWIAKLNPGAAVTLTAVAAAATPATSTLATPARPATSATPATPQLAAPVAIKPKRSPRLATYSLRAIATLAVLVLGLALWLSLGRHAFEAKAGGGAVAPGAPATSEITPDAVPAQPAVSAGDAPLPAGPSPADKLMQAAQTLLPPQVATPDAATAAGHKEKINSISISADTYRAGSRQNFVEIRVHRSSGSVGGTSFVWWTEPSTAVAGDDYMPQGRVTELLPAGTRAASLFIRLNAHASRKHSAVFYVAIGEPGNGASLGRIARATVVLPPK